MFCNNFDVIVVVEDMLSLPMVYRTLAKFHLLSFLNNNGPAVFKNRRLDKDNLHKYMSVI